MRIVYFTHSLVSCWNHGNAHFLRGLLRELGARGHDVQAFEPEHGWSRDNLLADHGEQAVAAFHSFFPELSPRTYTRDTDFAALLDGADTVIVHEWNEPWLVAAVAKLRRHGGGFRLLFHDTHHRAVSDPDAMRSLDLSSYDAILAFGETLATVYRGWGWDDRVLVLHEAADTRLFHPPSLPISRKGLVWIGNWGDGERSEELAEFLLAPAHDAGLALDIHGVRYPPAALAMLHEYGARYHGWLANAEAPATFARYMTTVHVPRRFYTRSLPGIPTIRVFEALACGIPLVCSPWQDSEHLFTPGKDYLVARDGAEMRTHLTSLTNDPGLRERLTAHGLATIAARHTCGHRADELLRFVDRLQSVEVT